MSGFNTIPPNAARPPGPAATQFDTKAAGKLCAALQARRKLQRANPNLGQWAAEFARLRAEVGQPAVKAALLWYAANIGGEYVPQAYSAASFRKKFPAILAAQARDPAPVKTAGPVAAAVKEIARGLQLRWPVAPRQITEAENLQFLQRTYDAYTDYLARLKAARLRYPAAEDRDDPVGTRTVSTDELLPGLILLLQSQAAPAAEFTAAWGRDTCRIAHTWDGWRGNLKAWAWRPLAKRWAGPVAVLLAEYSGRPEAFTKAMAVIY